MACGKKLQHAIQVYAKLLLFEDFYSITRKELGLHTSDLSCPDHYN